MVSNESVATSRFIQQPMRKNVDSKKAVGESVALKSAWDRFGGGLSNQRRAVWSSVIATFSNKRHLELLAQQTGCNIWLTLLMSIESSRCSIVLYI